MGNGRNLPQRNPAGHHRTPKNRESPHRIRVSFLFPIPHAAAPPTSLIPKTRRFENAETLGIAEWGWGTRGSKTQKARGRKGVFYEIIPTCWWPAGFRQVPRDSARHCGGAFVLSPRCAWMRMASAYSPSKSAIWSRFQFRPSNSPPPNPIPSASAVSKFPVLPGWRNIGSMGMESGEIRRLRVTSRNPEEPVGPDRNTSRRALRRRGPFFAFCTFALWPPANTHTHTPTPPPQ